MKLKKIISIAAACTLLSACAPFAMLDFAGSTVANAEGSDNVLLGDINNDGTIDSSDASLILSEYSLIQTGGEPSFSEAQQKTADLNKDGTIDSTDASFVLMYYAHVSTGGTMTIEEFLKSSNSPDTSDIPLISITEETDYFYFDKSRGVVAKVDGYFGVYFPELGETIEDCKLFKRVSDDVLDFIFLGEECNGVIVFGEDEQTVVPLCEVVFDGEIFVDYSDTLKVSASLVSTSDKDAVFNFNVTSTEPIYIFDIYKEREDGSWAFYDDLHEEILESRPYEINYNYTFAENGVFYVIFQNTLQVQNVTTVTVGNIDTEVKIDDSGIDTTAPKLTITTDSGTGLSTLTPFNIYVTADEVCDICVANQCTYGTKEAVGTVQTNGVYEIIAVDETGNKTVEYVTVTAYGNGKLPGEEDFSTPGNMNPLNPDNKDTFWEDAANGI